jgi:hypothetical protein
MSGFCMFLCDMLVSWSSKWQTMVSKSAPMRNTGGSPTPLPNAHGSSTSSASCTGMLTRQQWCSVTTSRPFTCRVIRCTTSIRNTSSSTYISYRKRSLSAKSASTMCPATTSSQTYSQRDCLLRSTLTFERISASMFAMLRLGGGGCWRGSQWPQ